MAPTPGAQKARDEKHYGYLGLFFRHFIEGTTQLLFAQDVPKRAGGEWGTIEPVPDTRVTEVFGEFFTQYYPHEHTDQPPYVWDASKRPGKPAMYGPSRRQATLRDGDVGVMNAVDTHDVAYLAEGLAALEEEWRGLKRDDEAGRQRLLVRMGKLLHGVEDWFFHSNVVELLELRSFRPAQLDGESDEEFLKRFVAAVAKHRPEFVDAAPTERLRLQRRLYRRLRFPAYDAGTKEQSAGRLSATRMSTPSLRHAYPAFPSSQDTAHTLLHALENLEHKAAGEPGELPAWVDGGAKAKGVDDPRRARLAGAAPRDGRRRARAAGVGAAGPHAAERGRAAAPGRRRRAGALAARPGRDQAAAHRQEVRARPPARAPRQGPGAPPRDDGRTESNYEQLVRYLVERGHLNQKRSAVAARRLRDRPQVREASPPRPPGAAGS